MRDPMDTIPEPPIPKDTFEDFWKETAAKWGVDMEKIASLKSGTQQRIAQNGNDIDDEDRSTLPEIELNDEDEDIVDTVVMTRSEIEREILFLLIEETVFKIRCFDFNEINVDTSKPHFDDAVARSLGALCEKYNLLLRISLSNNSFTILKKDGIDYTGLVMESEDGFVFHALLNNYPKRVTIA